MGLYDDIPPPGAGDAEEKGTSEEIVKETTAVPAKTESEGKESQGGTVHTPPTVSHTLYGDLKDVKEEGATEGTKNEGERSVAPSQPQRLNLSFLSRPRAAKGKASTAADHPQHTEPDKPSIVPPTLHRAIKRPRPPQASSGAAKRQRSAEGPRVVPMAAPVVHKVLAVPRVVPGIAEVRVEDEYDPFHPNTYAEFLVERQKRAAMVLQEEHDRAALLSLARNIDRGGDKNVPVELEACDTTATTDGDGDAVMTDESGEKAPKEKFAERMMKKMGWQEGQGLGRDGSGMVKPLEAKRTALGAGLIIDPDAEENAAKNAIDSPVLLLENMVESMAAADADLQEEVKEECESIGGAVEQILVTADMKNNPRIFVVFKELPAAKKVLENFNGRFFAGRQVSARHYSKQQFDRRQYIL